MAFIRNEDLEAPEQRALHRRISTGRPPEGLPPLDREKLLSWTASMEDPKRKLQLVRLLQKTYIFAETTENFRNAIVRRLMPVEYSAGQVIFSYGDPGDWMGIVMSGKLEKWLQRASTEIHLGAVRPGGIIGDIGLFGLNPNRSFTVRAETDSVLLVLSAVHFEDAVTTAGGPRSLSLFQDSGEMQNLMSDVNSFVNLQCFRHLDRDFVLALRENSEPRLYYPNQILMKEGQLGDEMFILRAGKVKIEKDRKLLVELPAGTVLGELAVLGSNKVRSATATCISLCFLRVLHADVFHELLDKFPAAKRTFEHSYVARLVSIHVRTNEAEKAEMDAWYGDATPRTRADVLTCLGEHEAAEDLRRAFREARMPPKCPLPKLCIQDGKVVRQKTPQGESGRLSMSLVGRTLTGSPFTT
mmetsp:Transcript_119690/g.334079  ORF Transcript_119690/g.334079 Transcript_119690/m.334079 type:complete len:414 (-) Transcript_119690:142-1383(-)